MYVSVRFPFVYFFPSTSSPLPPSSTIPRSLFQLAAPTCSRVRASIDNANVILRHRPRFLEIASKIASADGLGG